MNVFIVSMKPDVSYSSPVRNKNSVTHCDENTETIVRAGNCINKQLSAWKHKPQHFINLIINLSLIKIFEEQTSLYMYSRQTHIVFIVPRNICFHIFHTTTNTMQKNVIFEWLWSIEMFVLFLQNKWRNAQLLLIKSFIFFEKLVLVAGKFSTFVNILTNSCLFTHPGQKNEHLFLSMMNIQSPKVQYSQTISGSLAAICCNFISQASF